MSTLSIEALGRRAKSDWPLWLVVAFVALQPIGRLPEIPILIMALCGIKYLLIHYSFFCSSPSFKLFSVLFLCFWVPALLSLPDSLELKKGLISTVGMLRFYFSGAFIIYRIRSVQDHIWIGCATAAILSFWALDGIVELIFGRDVFGLSSGSKLYITGVYGENKRLGYALLAFLGVALIPFITKGITYKAALFSLLIAFVIFISGTRMAWLAALWFILFISVIAWRGGYRPSLSLSFGAILLSCVVVAAAFQTPSVSFRFNKTISVFTGTSSDQASSGRVSIFRTSLNMFQDNWVNGVGVRGFRYAYSQYAPQDDRFIKQNPSVGAYHPHNIVSEMLAETGVIGLAGLMTCLGVMVMLLWKTSINGISASVLSAAIVLALLMPINSHLSMYSSYWSSVFWILVALMISMLSVDDRLKISIFSNKESL